MRKILILLSIFLIAGIGNAFADDLDIDLACPTTVKVGQPLTVTVYLSNDDCNSSVSVSRLMMGVGGNSGGTLGGLGIWGPYNRPLSVTRTVPAATCDLSGTTPGTVPPFQLTIISSVPASLSGTMAMVMVAAITSSGETLSAGECLVAIVP